MADRDLRDSLRDASGGDPEAQRRYQRKFCRQNGHRWTHYKGGASVCEACGATEAPPERDWGNQTVYGRADAMSYRRPEATTVLPPEPFVDEDDSGDDDSVETED